MKRYRLVSPLPAHEMAQIVVENVRGICDVAIEQRRLSRRDNGQPAAVAHSLQLRRGHSRPVQHHSLFEKPPRCVLFSSRGRIGKGDREGPVTRAAERVQVVEALPGPPVLLHLESCRRASGAVLRRLRDQRIVSHCGRHRPLDHPDEVHGVEPHAGRNPEWRDEHAPAHLAQPSSWSL